MTEDKDEPLVAVASERSDLWKWFAWALPVVAVVVAGWLVYRAVPDIAESIVLKLDDANDISANSTLVFHRGVRIGIVTQVTLTPDLDGVRVKVNLDKGMERFATAGSQYWLVKPELDQGRLSGLSTIVSGPEIHAYPGSGEPATEFQVEDKQPLENIHEDDLKLRLTTPTQGAIGRGSKVFFRGVEAGVIAQTALNETYNQLDIEVRIYPEFAHLVRTNTRFWNSGGLDIDFGLFSGAEVRASSLQSMLSGSISFATPDEPGARVEAGHSFELADKANKKWLEWQPALAP